MPNAPDDEYFNPITGNALLLPAAFGLFDGHLGLGRLLFHCLAISTPILKLFGGRSGLLGWLPWITSRDDRNQAKN